LKAVDNTNSVLRDRLTESGTVCFAPSGTSCTDANATFIPYAELVAYTLRS